MSTLPLLLRPYEVAAIWRCHEKTVRRWAVEGRLNPVATPGGHRRYRLDEIRGLLAADGFPAEEIDALIAAALADEA